MKIVAVRITDTELDKIITIYGRRDKNREVLLRRSIKGMEKHELLALAQQVEGTYAPLPKE